MRNNNTSARSQRRKFEQNAQEILKKYKSTCLCPNCAKPTINSHVIQKSILETITQDNHVYFFRQENLFEGGQAPKYMRTSIGNSMSFQGFCSTCDNEIFRPIETHPVDWMIYQSQFLLGYRTLCRELYVKCQVAHLYKKLEQITTLSSVEQNHYSAAKRGLEYGIEDFEKYKKIIEAGIDNEGNTQYFFETIKLGFRLELCVASSVSVSYSDISADDWINADIIEMNTINIFPYNENTIVIIGFANNFDNKWAKELSENLKSGNWSTISKSLSDLILFRADFNCMSKQLYTEIGSEKIKQFEDAFYEDIPKKSYGLSTSLNIFDGLSR